MTFSDEIYKNINKHKHFNEKKISTSYHSFNRKFFLTQNKLRNQIKHKKYLNQYIEYLTHIFD